MSESQAECTLNEQNRSECDIAANPFADENALSDLTLVVEDKKLYVHKLSLALVSPVFKALLFPESDFREKDDSEMPLPDKKYKDVVDFLTQIYAEHCHQPITDDNLVGVMALGDEYQVDHVINKCQRYVEAQLKVRSKLSTAELMMYLWICKRYQHRGLQQSIDTAIVGVVERPIQDVQKCEYYSQLTSEDQNDIIFKRCQRLEKEHAVVQYFADKVHSAFPNTNKESCNCHRHDIQKNLYSVSDGSKFYLNRNVCSKCISVVARRIASGPIWGEID